MDEEKVAARRIKRLLFTSGACASPDVVDPLPKSEKSRNFRELWVKRQKRFREEEKSSPAVDLLPSSAADNLQSIGDKVAELPLVTVENVTPLATSNESQDATIKKAEHPLQMNMDELRVPRCLIQRYNEEVESSDNTMSKLCDLAENEKLMRASLLSKEKLAANNSSLLDAEIFGLSQLISEKEILQSEKLRSDSVKHSILNILRKEPLIPVDCQSDFKLVKLLKDEYQWNGEVVLSDSVDEA